MINSNVILDADVIAYMASAGAEEHDGVLGEEDSETLLENAFHRAEDMVEGWIEAALQWPLEPIVELGKIKLAFSGPSEENFRRKVHPQYKHNRTGEKPEGYEEVVQHLKSSYPWVQDKVLEGDDLLGMHMCNDWIAVSTDKDMQTVPGLFVRIRTNGDIDRYNSSESEANRFWMYQTLTGDTVDGYKGCPGCGPKGADKVLKFAGSLSHMWDKVLQRYEEAWNKPSTRAKFVTGHPYDEALMNARCARILRDGDYPIEGVKLWNP